MRKLIVIVVVAGIVLIAGLAIAIRVLLGGDRIKAAIEAQAAAALGQPVTIQTAVPRLFPRVSLDLRGITIGNAREVTIEQVRLATGFRALVQRRIQDAEIQVERSQIDVRWALALLAALVDANTVEAPAPAQSSAFAIDSIGAITLRNLALVAGKHTLNVDMDSSLTGGDRFVIDRLQGRSDRSDFRASGEFSSVSKRTGTFTVDAETLDLDGLLAFFAAATPAGGAQLASGRAGKAPRTNQQPLHVDVSVRAKRGRALGVALTNMTTTCRVAGSDVLLEKLRMELFGGRYDGSVAFRGSQGESARTGSADGRYEWRGTVENLDVPQLAAFAGAAGSITGRLAGTLSITASGVDPQQAIQRARGTARVAITDGRIPGLEIVRSVILAFGKPSTERPAGSGEAFTRLAATLAVAGQQLATNDLSFASRDFDMAGQGTMSLGSQAVDFHADVVLSRELSAQAGRDLYRVAREGDRVVLPARITGTVSAPTVFVDVQAALNRALRNRAEDELKSLLDRLQKRIIRN
jgi:uncharacterized protein involved in outer membrane biogenesis